MEWPPPRNRDRCPASTLRGRNSEQQQTSAWSTNRKPECLAERGAECVPVRIAERKSEHEIAFEIS